ncbi:MAG: hypothetical protein HKL95_05455 [Phycisphaerae bacterium]|nr:hypothetical protein [Phycisphaerae bacterium]
MGLALLPGCRSNMAPVLPALPAARHTPAYAVVAHTISRMHVRCRRTLFATLKFQHQQISMIGRLNLISTTNFQLTAADEFGRLLFLVRRRPAHPNTVQAAAGIPGRFALSMAQDIVISLLPPAHGSRHFVWHVLPSLHAVKLTYRDELGNIHHGVFTGSHGYLRRADIRLPHHGCLQVLYSRYNATGFPRKLWIRQPDAGWLLMLDFNGSRR